jgi:methionine sulfoxide reductase heme-binding subunit
VRLLAGALGVAGVNLGADPVEEILETCGLWTLRFLLITLTVTPLRRLTGLNDLIRFRRMLGLFAFTYACLHFLAYLVLDRGVEWGAIVEDIAKRPYITIGFTALVLLFPLAFTSTKSMMRRLGRRWQRLHRLVYVIAILGVWHYYWQVKADVRDPLLYAAVLALLLGYRAWKSQRLQTWRREWAQARTSRRGSGSLARSDHDGGQDESAAEQRRGWNGFTEKQQPEQ